MNAKTIKEWLAVQEDYEYSPVPDTIKVVRDPEVRGTWAVQFEDEDGETIQLLFVTGGEDGSDSEVLANTLEEVEFGQWPPVSGALKFFW